MSRFSHIASRVFNRPLLMEMSRAEFMFGYLNGRMKLGGLQTEQGFLSAEQCQAKADSFSPSRVRGSYSVQGGIAIIPVDGSLVHKSGYVDSSSGIRGYDGITAMVEDAVHNTQVKGILLDVDSGGGEVAGVQSLGEVIRVASAVLPVWAHANEMAASAAYWIASSANKVYLSETASVGSIGVLTAHTDVSSALDEAGYKITLIYSGDHKVDGNPYEPLSTPIKESLQAEIDALRTLFASTVASNRKVDVKKIMDTEAKMYRGQAAVDAGLADEVKSFSSTLAAMQAFVKTAATAGNFKGGTMSAQTDAPAVVAGSFTQADVDAAKVQATTAERSRCSAIFSLPEAKGREATAAQLMATDMGVDAVKCVLATIPVSNPSASILVGLSQAAGVDAGAETTVTKNRVDTGFDNLMAKGASK